MFVFLFLLVFAPFQFDSIGKNLFEISLGYGITTVVIVMMSNLLLMLFSPPTLERQWTVWHELIWTIFCLLLVSVGNLFYSYYAGIFPLTLNALSASVVYTLAVGLFPIVVSVLVKEIRLSHRFEVKSANINLNLKSHAKAEQEEESLITIMAGQPKDNLQVAARDLLFIRAAENYIDIFYLDSDKLERKLQRNSLTTVAAQLESVNSSFFRCHKSYLVNLIHVKHVSGNAQGYKLHLAHTDEAVPVSRQHNATLHQRLTVAP